MDRKASIQSPEAMYSHKNIKLLNNLKKLIFKLAATDQLIAVNHLLICNFQD